MIFRLMNNTLWGSKPDQLNIILIKWIQLHDFDQLCNFNYITLLRIEPSYFSTTKKLKKKILYHNYSIFIKKIDDLS